MIGYQQASAFPARAAGSTPLHAFLLISLAQIASAVQGLAPSVIEAAASARPTTDAAGDLGVAADVLHCITTGFTALRYSLMTLDTAAAVLVGLSLTIVILLGVLVVADANHGPLARQHTYPAMEATALRPRTSKPGGSPGSPGAPRAAAAALLSQAAAGAAARLSPQESRSAQATGQTTLTTASSATASTSNTSQAATPPTAATSAKPLRPVGRQSLDRPPRTASKNGPTTNGHAADKSPMRWSEAPPLCPTLVMPSQEAWFAVSVEKLLEGADSFNILGISGTPLLRATVRNGSTGRRKVEISMTPYRSPMLASIGLPKDPAQAMQSDALEVRTACDSHYGWLQPSSSGYSLVCGDAEVLTMTSSDAGYVLKTLGSQGTMNGIARATRLADSGFFAGGEHVEVRVLPRVDAVMVLLCVLRVVSFGGRSALPVLTSV